MSLAEELGLDPETLRWQQLAACNNFPMSWYFDDYEADEEIAKATDAGCLSCPVLRECQMQGMSNNEWGVWGGVYWNGSGKPDKARNAHKTDEIWNQIRDRISG